jgi:hypothetical protein
VSGALIIPSLIGGALIIPAAGSVGPPGAPGAPGVNGAAGSNVMAVPSRSGANGSNVSSAALVKTACAHPSRPGQGGADYFPDNTVDLAACPQAGFTDNVGQKYRIVSEQPINSQQFYEPTDSSYGQCIQRGIDYLTYQIGVNGGIPDDYRGTVPFRVPAGDYASNISIDVRADIDLHGDGSGSSVSSYGATHIHFTGCSGFRLQFPTTHDDDGIVVGPDLKGVSRCKLRDFMLTGDLTLNKHAIVQRAMADISNIHGRNWGGLVIRAWTGNSRGVAYGGQCSTSTAKQILGFNCQGTISLGGTDTNVYNTDGINGYQNRQFGLEDFNAAGANKHRGGHYTYNGFGAIAGLDSFTMCSQSGNIYTPNLACVDFTSPAATSALLAAHAPSGTTADNAYWLYQGPGGPTASQPAYASGGPWCYGGDTLCMTPWSTEFDNNYFEGGGALSQALYHHPVWRGGTLSNRIVGGTLELSTDDAFEIIRSGGGALIVRGGDNSAGSISVRDFSNFLWWQLYATFGGTTAYYVYANHYFTNSLGLIGHIGVDGMGVEAGMGFSVAGTTVLNGQMAAIADLAAAPTMADFNGLLAKLRGVKLLAP